MANVLDMQIAEEGPRNAVVKLTGVLDTSDVTEVPAFGPGDFRNNDQGYGSLSGFRVDECSYSIGPGIEVVLAWKGAPPQQIFPLSGWGKLNAKFGGGYLPDTTIPGYDGSIILTTSGFQMGVKQNFTLLLRLVKLYKR